MVTYSQVNVYFLVLILYSNNQITDNIFLNNFELQVGDHDMTQGLQMHLTLRSPKVSMHQRPSRISSKISLSSQRIGLWFHFYFTFFEYFCLFYILLFKIQDSGSFHSPWLVNIQVNRLIVQMSRVEDSLLGTLCTCWGSKQHLSIEWPGDWITP